MVNSRLSTLHLPASNAVGAMPAAAGPRRRAGNAASPGISQSKYAITPFNQKESAPPGVGLDPAGRDVLASQDVRFEGCARPRKRDGMP